MFSRALNWSGVWGILQWYPLQPALSSVLLPHSNPKRWVVVNGGPEVCFGGLCEIVQLSEQRIQYKELT